MTERGDETGIDAKLKLAVVAAVVVGFALGVVVGTTGGALTGTASDGSGGVATNGSGAGTVELLIVTEENGGETFEVGEEARVMANLNENTDDGNRWRIADSRNVDVTSRGTVDGPEGESEDREGSSIERTFSLNIKGDGWVEFEYSASEGVEPEETFRVNFDVE